MVVPILGRMSDSNDEIRSTATNIFASLVKMVPLEVCSSSYLSLWNKSCLSNAIFRLDCPILLDFRMTFLNGVKKSVNSSVNCWMDQKLNSISYQSRSKLNCANINKMVSIGLLSWPNINCMAFFVTVIPTLYTLT
jgi:hypothetical protein